MDQLIASLKKTVAKYAGLHQDQVTSLATINTVDYTDGTINTVKQLIHSKEYHKLKNIPIEYPDDDSLVICDVKLIDGTRLIALVIDPLELYLNGYVESTIQY